MSSKRNSLFGALLASAAALLLLSSLPVRGQEAKHHLSNGNQIDTIRVAKKYANYIHLQCPLSSSGGNNLVNLHQVKWVNEADYWDQPDSSVQLSHMNVIGFSKLSYQLNENTCYLSCGYIYNNCYKRVKIWKIIYVDACVTLHVRPNPPCINLKPINDSTSAVSLVRPISDWSSAIQLLQLKCENNFDLPLSKKYVWMYFYNSITGANEIWHKYDLDNENVYQMFINAKDSKSLPLSDFLKYLFECKVDSIKFQCASYYDKYNTNDLVYLITDSKNTTIIRHPEMVTVTEAIRHTTQHTHDHGALIGGLVGGILGLLLLLTLLAFLLYCCYKRRKQSKSDRNVITQSTTYIYPMPMVQADNFGSSITTTYLPTSSVTLMDKQFTNQITDVRSTSTYDIDQQHSQQHNLSIGGVSTNNQAMNSDLYSTKRIGGGGGAMSRAAIDAHNSLDNCGDNMSVRFAERNNLYSDDGREYVTDEEFFHQTRDFYVQNYQQQPNDINVHYV